MNEIKIYEEDAMASKNEITSDNSDKPIVYLIGDSIRMGYCNHTKERLNDVARVMFPDDNCKFTQNTFVNLGYWRNYIDNCENVKVVCWNNGHWDIAHWDMDESSLNTVEIYTDMLIRIYKKIKRYFPNAKIVFQTTSPMNPSGIISPNHRTRCEIEKYNAAALKALSDYDIIIDDIYEYLKDEPEDIYEDYCHLTDEGFKKLGIHVADFVRKIL